MATKKPKVTAQVNPLNRGKKQDPPQPQKLLNHIAIVVDESGSMGHLTRKVQEVVNDQLGVIKSAARDNDQETKVTLTTFEGGNIKHHFRNAFPESVNFYNYQPSGNTNLNDAINDAITNLEHASQKGRDESFLVIVITDGFENASRGPAPGQRIQDAQKTDRWSFAFMVPPGSRNATSAATGVPLGNIKEWEATEFGLQEAFQATRKGTVQYFSARSQGINSTQAFYTDMSNVTRTDLQNLQDLSGTFNRWKVDKETDITSFVQSHINGGYQIGRGYYQLTKPEEIQSHKDVVIGEKRTKKLYGGDEAKKLIGIPSGPGVTVKVKPGNHGDYDIFVKSTSTNRKLVRGTEFLYAK